MTLQAEIMPSVLNKQWENLQLFGDLLKKFVKTLTVLTDGYKGIGK